MQIKFSSSYIRLSCVVNGMFRFGCVCSVVLICVVVIGEIDFFVVFVFMNVRVCVCVCVCVCVYVCMCECGCVRVGVIVLCG